MDDSVGVDFTLMLDAAGKVLQRDPIESYVSKHEDLVTVLDYLQTYTKANNLKRLYTKKILSEYFRLTCESRKDKKLAYDLAKEACKAFHVVSGHTWSSASKFIYGKSLGRFDRDLVKFFRHYYLAAKSYPRVNPDSWQILEALIKENQALGHLLAWVPGVFGINSELSRESFKEMKEGFMKYNTYSKGDWKFLTQQSKSWVLSAMRIRSVLNCIQMRLRYSHLRNDFIKVLMQCGGIMGNPKAFNIFYKEIHNYDGCIKNFSPFPVGFRWGLHCRELDIINDFLYRNDTTATTLHGLYRQASEWHETIKNIQKGQKVVFNYPFDNNYTIDGINFELIGDSHRLYAEGKDMKHCVFSYADRCYAGRYVVFHATKESEKATLGLELTDEVVYNQFYGPCNARVLDEFTKAARKLVRILNKREN